MTPITRLLSNDHDHCDQLFATAENAVQARDWAHAGRAFAAFASALERHFHAEEQVLFPAFEARSGMSGGPTFVMRSEHLQMRELVEQMSAALANQDDAGFIGASETLLMLMRQHNLKEEQILYPMTDRVLADATDLVGALEKTLQEG
ncbi:MAG: hemerythrin domain-containing protein [Thiobacillaceae bacterium]